MLCAVLLSVFILLGHRVVFVKYHRTSVLVLIKYLSVRRGDGQTNDRCSFITRNVSPFQRK